MLYVDFRERFDNGDRIVADHTNQALDRFLATAKDMGSRTSDHTFHDDGAGACTVGDTHIGAVKKAVLEEAPGGMT